MNRKNEKIKKMKFFLENCRLNSTHRPVIIYHNVFSSTSFTDFRYFFFFCCVMFNLYFIFSEKWFNQSITINKVITFSYFNQTYIWWMNKFKWMNEFGAKQSYSLMVFLLVPFTYRKRFMRHFLKKKKTFPK